MKMFVIGAFILGVIVMALAAAAALNSLFGVQYGTNASYLIHFMTGAALGWPSGIVLSEVINN